MKVKQNVVAVIKKDLCMIQGTKMLTNVLMPLKAVSVEDALTVTNENL
jgi:hypothetical protein